MISGNTNWHSLNLSVEVNDSSAGRFVYFYLFLNLLSRFVFFIASLSYFIPQFPFLLAVKGLLLDAFLIIFPASFSLLFAYTYSIDLTFVYFLVWFCFIFLCLYYFTSFSSLSTFQLILYFKKKILFFRIFSLCLLISFFKLF